MIELKNINVSFGKHHVLRNLNETFESGEVIGLVAPNGTGKSTLLNVMMNYLKPQSGEVVIEGSKKYKGPKENSRIYQDISMMPDQNDLYPHLSGYDHLKMYQDMYKRKNISVDDVIKELEMGHYVKKKVSDYSLGMKQRLCFAMQMVSDTKIMLMDEVMNGLDPNNVELISKVIIKKRDEGKTIVIASHLLENLEKYSNRIFFLFGGVLELFLDKKQGYADESTYIRLKGISLEEATELFPDKYLVSLNEHGLVVRVEEKEQVTKALEKLIAADMLEFSVGHLSLTDSYQLKF
ncbi:ABC transporter ATP-binding protein [Vagococcus fluvialis]|uniref:ABC transporter ATP-binding protein n=1 Tax=Vagococcus fluvialis TaxID=2738 RepID=UPI001A8CC423|nr:ABC transporter ATP-binding protein [Vagococcus fluvialis]MBO0486159.1 ABC transporter ATP-binding protein [Vagococcus fluvialis]MDT2781049.1 ABC transporter ATP-binding protein [Vagococcus fluvialis]UDM70054.1 ABC transporter ATP-binding protein [Vagococcus fluvialis]UDM77472.1 ABC transporter ATP-binding protein [Vagococcus fluvialis]UDM81740.1 ABC transporter ATP-binding protein [Vagococcus fluvialis]